MQRLSRVLNIISRVTQSESDEISIGSSLLLLSIGSSSRELFTARLSSSSSSDKQIRIFAYPSFGVLSTGGAGVGAETCDGDGNGDRVAMAIAMAILVTEKCSLTVAVKVVTLLFPHFLCLFHHLHHCQEKIGVHIVFEEYDQVLLWI